MNIHKYTILIIIGIILFILLNNIDSFSIGVPEYKIVSNQIVDIRQEGRDRYNSSGDDVLEGRVNIYGNVEYFVWGENMEQALNNFNRYIESRQGAAPAVPEPESVSVSHSTNACSPSLSSPQPIDDKVLFVDLSKVQEDRDPSAKDILLFLEKSNLPGCLEYVDETTETKLNIVHEINSGSYGTVYSYASESSLPPNWIIKASRRNPENRYYYNTVTNKNTSIRPRIPGDNYIAVAVKVFKNPNDNEIEIVRQLNGIYGYKCDTVRSRIIGLSKFGTQDWAPRINVVLMEIMDGDLNDLLKKEEYHDSILGVLHEMYIIPIMLQLATILKCLLDLNYIYADLQEGNILFKRDNEGRIHIVLGDLGSIVENGIADWRGSTYPTPEFMYRNQPGVDYLNRINPDIMIWGFGVVLLILLGVDSKWFYHGSNFPNWYHSCNAKDPKIIKCGVPEDGATECPDNPEHCVFTAAGGLSSAGSCALTTQRVCESSINGNSNNNTRCLQLKCSYTHDFSFRKETIEEYYSNIEKIIGDLDIQDYLDIQDSKLAQIITKIFKRGRDINIDQILDILYDCESNQAWSNTGLLPCSFCREKCNDNQIETQVCTPTQNRECRQKLCNREEFCNNRGWLTNTDSTYPECDNCRCSEGWGGKRCEISLDRCIRNQTWSTTGYEKWSEEEDKIPCEDCREECNDDQIETQVCTLTQNRECREELCDREDFCNNHGTTNPEGTYPECDNCQCDTQPSGSWGGKRCEITLDRCIRNQTWSTTGYEKWSEEEGKIPCEGCTLCNDDEIETQACTSIQNRECRQKSCNRRDFCNNRGTTNSDGIYPNCEKCECEGSGYDGNRCENKIKDCSQITEPAECQRANCTWSDDPQWGGCYD